VHVVIWLRYDAGWIFFLIRQGFGLGDITHARELERVADCSTVLIHLSSSVARYALSVIPLLERTFDLRGVIS